MTTRLRRNTAPSNTQASLKDAASAARFTIGRDHLLHRSPTGPMTWPWNMAWAGRPLRVAASPDCSDRNVTGMGRGALLRHRVHQRDADGAAEIAHQIEQCAGVRQLQLRPSLHRQPRGWKDAEHDPTPRSTCGRTRSSKSVWMVQKASARSPAREQGIADRHQQLAADARFQPRRHRRGHELRRARHHHDLPDLQRGVLAHESQEQRQQISRGVQSHAEHEAQQAADRKLRSPKRRNSTNGAARVRH